MGPDGRKGFESTGPVEEDAGGGSVDLAGEESPMEEVAESESSSESDWTCRQNDGCQQLVVFIPMLIGAQ